MVLVNKDKWPRCPSCNTGNVARLWTVGGHEPIVAAKVSSAPFAPSKDIDGAGIAALHVSPGGKEVAIDTGFRCRECGRHWFQIPGDRMKAVDKLLDFVKDIQRTHDKPSLAACNALPEEQQNAVQAGDSCDVNLTNPLWILRVEFRNEDPGFYAFTDEFSAWQYLATEIVNEMVNENDYPEVQALLDAGTTECNVEAAKLYFNQCDPTKRSFTISRTEGPLHPSRLPAGDHSGPGCIECGWKGWEIFNEGEPGTPLGVVQADDNCTAKLPDWDDDVANAHAVLAGYRTLLHDGQHVVVKRPEDEAPVVAPCKGCEVPHLLSEMVTVNIPTATYPLNYCPACYGGVKLVVNAK